MNPDKITLADILRVAKKWETDDFGGLCEVVIDIRDGIPSDNVNKDEYNRDIEELRNRE